MPSILKTCNSHLVWKLMWQFAWGTKGAEVECHNFAFFLVEQHNGTTKNHIVLFTIVVGGRSIWTFRGWDLGNPTFGAVILFFVLVVGLLCGKVRALKYWTLKTIDRDCHSSGTVWESRWPSWAVRPNEPFGFRGRKAILNHASALVSACP